MEGGGMIGNNKFVYLSSRWSTNGFVQAHRKLLKTRVVTRGAGVPSSNITRHGESPGSGKKQNFSVQLTNPNNVGSTNLLNNRCYLHNFGQHQLPRQSWGNKKKHLSSSRETFCERYECENFKSL